MQKKQLMPHSTRVNMSLYEHVCDVSLGHIQCKYTRCSVTVWSVCRACPQQVYTMFSNTVMWLQGTYNASIHVVQSQAGAWSLAELPTSSCPLRRAWERLVCREIRVGIDSVLSLAANFLHSDHPRILMITGQSFCFSHPCRMYGTMMYGG